MRYSPREWQPTSCNPMHVHSHVRLWTCSTFFYIRQINTRKVIVIHRVLFTSFETKNFRCGVINPNKLESSHRFIKFCILRVMNPDYWTDKKKVHAFLTKSGHNPTSTTLAGLHKQYLELYTHPLIVGQNLHQPGRRTTRKNSIIMSTTTATAITGAVLKTVQSSLPPATNTATPSSSQSNINQSTASQLPPATIHDVPHTSQSHTSQSIISSASTSRLTPATTQNTPATATISIVSTATNQPLNSVSQTHTSSAPTAPFTMHTLSDEVNRTQQLLRTKQEQVLQDRFLNRLNSGVDLQVALNELNEWKAQLNAIFPVSPVDNQSSIQAGYHVIDSVHHSFNRSRFGCCDHIDCQFHFT